jgi:hypothetical protein
VVAPSLNPRRLLPFLTPHRGRRLDASAPSLYAGSRPGLEARSRPREARMLYAVIVGTTTTENWITALHVLAVHRDLTLEEAMRLLGERPADTIGRVQRLPADLPAIGEVLRLDLRSQGPATVNAMTARRARRRRDLESKP